MSLSTLDWVIVFIILFSALQAAASGFLREFIAFVGAIAGFLIASRQYPGLAGWYARYINSHWVAEVAAFFTIFLIVGLLAGVLGKMAGRVVQDVGLGWFDRFLGAVFGLLRGIVVSVVVVMALAAFAPQWGVAQSRIAPFMVSAGRALVWAAPAEFRQRFREGWNLLRQAPEHIPYQRPGTDSSQHN